MLNMQPDYYSDEELAEVKRVVKSYIEHLRENVREVQYDEAMQRLGIGGVAEIDVSGKRVMKVNLAPKHQILIGEREKHALMYTKNTYEYDDFLTNVLSRNIKMALQELEPATRAVLENDKSDDEIDISISDWEFL